MAFSEALFLLYLAYFFISCFAILYFTISWFLRFINKIFVRLKAVFIGNRHSNSSKDFAFWVMFFPFLDLMLGFLKSYNPSFPSIPTSGPPKRSLAFPSGLKRHLGREEAFKEGKGIQGGKRHTRRDDAFKEGRRSQRGNFWGQTNIFLSHSRREIFCLDKWEDPGGKFSV